MQKGIFLFTFVSGNVEKHCFMKCSELFRLLKRDGWYPVSQKGSHVKMRHDEKDGVIIFPNHGSQEVGKGLAKRILKDAGIEIKN